MWGMEFLQIVVLKRYCSKYHTLSSKLVHEFIVIHESRSEINQQKNTFDMLKAFREGF